MGFFFEADTDLFIEELNTDGFLFSIRHSKRINKVIEDCKPEGFSGSALVKSTLKQLKHGTNAESLPYLPLQNNCSVVMVTTIKFTKIMNGYMDIEKWTDLRPVKP